MKKNLDKRHRKQLDFSGISSLAFLSYLFLSMNNSMKRDQFEKEDRWYRDAS